MYRIIIIIVNSKLINTFTFDYAIQRRKLYLNRHKNDKSDAGFYAREILW